MKAYFEKGYSLTHYLFKVLAVIGIISLDVTYAIYSAVCYALFCYLVGRLWFKLGFINQELEVINRVNPFVDEMRHSLGVTHKTEKYLK